MDPTEVHELLTWVQCTAVPIPALAAGISSTYALHAGGYAAVMYGSYYEYVRPPHVPIPSVLPTSLPSSTGAALPALDQSGIYSLQAALQPLHLIQLLASVLPHKVLDKSAPSSVGGAGRSKDGGKQSRGDASVANSDYYSDNTATHTNNNNTNHPNSSDGHVYISTLDGHQPLMPVLVSLAQQRSPASLVDRSFASEERGDEGRDEEILCVFLGGCKRLGLRCGFRTADLLEGMQYTAVVDNLRELYAMAKARAAAMRGEECEVQYDYSNLLVRVARDAADVQGGDDFHTPALTYYEHMALYSGVLSPLLVNPAGRARLWAYLLNYEDEYVAHPGTTSAMAKLAMRRISEARKRCAASDDVDEHVHLMYSHVSSSAGLMLVRRKLIRALARAGLPPHFRGYLWSRFAGLVQPGLPPLRLTSDGPSPKFTHADSRLCPAIPTSVWERRNNTLMAGQACHASTRAFPAHPASSPVTTPIPAPEVPVLDLQANFVPSPQLSKKLTQLTYYDFLLLLNADSLEAHGQMPAYLAPLVALLRVEVAAWRASNPSLAPAPDTPTSPKSARAQRQRVLLERADHLQPDSDFKMWWDGRVYAPANLDTVTQVSKDLPRTVPHLQAIEPSRVHVSRMEDTSSGAASLAAGWDYHVQHVYAARRHAADGETDSCLGGVVPTVSQAIAPLSRTARDLHFSLEVPAEETGAQASSLDIGPATHLDPFKRATRSAQRSVHVSEGALRRVLLAFSSHSPVLDFVQGLPFLAAHALRWLGEADAFALFSALLHAIVPADYYTDRTAGVVRDQRILEELIATCNDLSPLLDHLATLSNAPRSTVLGLIQSATLQWFICLFTVPFSPAFSDRVWDALICEGDAVIFRVTLALLRCAMPKLMATDEFHVAMDILKGCHLLTFQPAFFSALFDCWLWPHPDLVTLAAGIAESTTVTLRASLGTHPSRSPTDVAFPSLSRKILSEQDEDEKDLEELAFLVPSEKGAALQSGAASTPVPPPARIHRASLTKVPGTRGSRAPSNAELASPAASPSTEEGSSGPQHVETRKRLPAMESVAHGLFLLLLSFPQFTGAASKGGFHIPPHVVNSLTRWAFGQSGKLEQKKSSKRSDGRSRKAKTPLQAYGFGISALTTGMPASQHATEVKSGVDKAGRFVSPEARARGAALETVDDAQVAQYEADDPLTHTGPTDARGLVLPASLPVSSFMTALMAEKAAAEAPHGTEGIKPAAFETVEEEQAVVDTDADSDAGTNDVDGAGISSSSESVSAGLADEPASVSDGTHTILHELDVQQDDPSEADMIDEAVGLAEMEDLVTGPQFPPTASTPNTHFRKRKPDAQLPWVGWLRNNSRHLAVLFYGLPAAQMRGLVWRESMFASSSLIASRRAFYIQQGKLAHDESLTSARQGMKGLLPEYVLGIQVSGLLEPEDDDDDGGDLAESADKFSDDDWETSNWHSQPTQQVERPPKRLSFAINLKPTKNTKACKVHAHKRRPEDPARSERLLALLYRDGNTGKPQSPDASLILEYFPLIQLPLQTATTETSGEARWESHSISQDPAASVVQLHEFLGNDSEYWAAPVVTPPKKSGVCVTRLTLQHGAEWEEGELLGACIIPDYFRRPTPEEILVGENNDS